MKKLVYFAAAALLTFFACTPEDKEKIEEIVNPKEVVATAIELSSHELTLEKGANSILTVTYTPSDVTKKDITWVSSNTSIVTVNDGIVVGVETGETEIIAKCGDVTDKCKVTVVISATSIKLNKTSLELHLHDTEALIATIEPDNTTDSIVWESSDEGVATVEGGVVTAVGAGEATITANAGNQKAECKVTVSAIVVPEAIDLGLSVKWASFNLGSSKPEEYGNYYAWGETEPKDNYSWSTYKFGNSSSGPLSKYSTLESYGTVDNKTVLEPEDDAAHVKLGGRWRIPTKDEWTALCEQCNWTWTTQNGVDGHLVTAANGNSIFLPAAGLRDESNLYNTGSIGYYWSSCLFTDDPIWAWYVFFFEGDVYWYYWYIDHRYIGFSIRPVTE